MTETIWALGAGASLTIKSAWGFITWRGANY